MIHSQFVDLGRSFYLIPSKSQKVGLDIEFLQDSGESVGWNELTKEIRVVILSEAGSGKTSEMMQTAVRIAESGKFSFFLRLENLADAFDPFELGDWNRVDDWLNSTDPGWFFLDSVDEARLGDPR